MHICSRELKRLIVPIPSLSKQTAIARFLDDADRNIGRCIRVNERGIRLLLEYRTRVISDVVIGNPDVRSATKDLPRTGYSALH